LLPAPSVAAPARLACFVTPHGFGHAARTCAVLSALARRLPLAAELFTTVPDWLFADSLDLPWRRHPVRCDVGLVQGDALHEDLAATADALDELLPFGERQVTELAQQVLALGCRAVLCDVAPLGLAVATAANLPLALVENFTWDWIYTGYLDREPRLARHATTLASCLAGVDVRVQTAPACLPVGGAVQVEPVARAARRRRDEVRDELGLLPGERAVLLTMGGIAWDFTSFAPRPPDGVVLVVPGGAAEPRRIEGAVLLPFRGPFYHPDLVAAADAVVGKLGYSTLAEAWTAGVPYGFIARRGFPESPVLASFLTAAGAGRAVPPSVLAESDWSWLSALLAAGRGAPRPGGADAAAAALARGLGLGG
jgi:hypothetical protein